MADDDVVEDAVVVTLPDTKATQDIESVRDAARALSLWRRQKQQAADTGQPAESPPADSSAPDAPRIAPPPPEEGERDTAAEPDQAEPSGEPQEQEPEAAQEETAPAIEPPRFMSAEEKDLFAKLPPELQHRLLDRESRRNQDIERRLAEAAETRRQAEMVAAAAAQAQAQYEQALPLLLQRMTASGEFADIKTWDDVKKLSEEDWPRYVKFDAHLKEMQAVQQQWQAAQQRQAQEGMAQFQQYAAQQDALFAQRVPEFTDAEKAKELSDLTIATLQSDYGFTTDEMLNAWHGPFRDARVQQLLLDAARYRALKKHPPKPVKANVPPVQRPGAARAPVSSQDADVRDLETKLNSTHSIKDAAKLLGARRRVQLG